MASGPIGDKEVGAFNVDGFVLARGMLDAVEVDLLGRAAREDRVLDQHAFGRADGEGGTVRLSLWNHPTDTIYGMIARSESNRRLDGAAPGRRGLSLSLQDDR